MGTQKQGMQAQGKGRVGTWACRTFDICSCSLRGLPGWRGPAPVGRDTRFQSLALRWPAGHAAINSKGRFALLVVKGAECAGP